MKPFNQIPLTIISIFTLITGLTNQIQAQTIPLLISNSQNKKPTAKKQPVFVPPDTKPGQGPTKPKGSRPTDCPNPINNQDITPLVPPQIGQTISDHPTFWIYVPYPKASRPVEFTLIGLVDGKEKSLYQTQFLIQEDPGIISITLPKTVPPLAIGKKYKWSFSYICNPNDREKDMFLSRYIQRVAVKPDLQNQLATATPSETVILYGKNGLWYDMLTSLGEIRRSKPEDKETVENWVDLLNSVGLKDIANEPVTPCCTIKP